MKNQRTIIFENATSIKGTAPLEKLEVCQKRNIGYDGF